MSKNNKTKNKPKGEKRCAFCGSTKHLERHHCFQLMFKQYYEGNINESDNLIWVCSHCHRTLHDINSNMMNTLKKHLSKKKGKDYRREHR